MTRRITARRLLASLVLAWCASTSAAGASSSASASANSSASSAASALAASASNQAASGPAAVASEASKPADSAASSPSPDRPAGYSPGRADAMASVPGTPARESSAVGHLMQVMGALMFVIMLMLGLAWFVKNHGPKSLLGRVPVKVVGGVNLGGRERVLVIEVADQWLVLGATPSQITTLATLPRQATPDDEPVPGKQFSLWLKQIMEKRNG